MLAPPTLEKKKSTQPPVVQAVDEMNLEYEAALMQTMLQRMKSSITQKMMSVVEQERALMLE